MKYPNRVRDLRTNVRQISQRKLAEALGISESALQNYEYGNRQIPGDVLLRMASFFGCSTDAILCVESLPNEPAELFELKRIREVKGISPTTAAEAIGVDLNEYLAWEDCLWSPRSNVTIKRIADYFDVPIEALFGYDLVEPGAFSRLVESSEDKFKYVPLVADIAAGKPTEQDDIENHIPIPIEVMGKHPHAFLLRINGTSMSRVLPEGCFALVDPDRMGSVIENKPYAVKINGDMATVKRLRRLSDGWLLVPDSYDSSWQPIALHEGDGLYEEMRIIGEVVWYTLPFDWSF